MFNICSHQVIANQNYMKISSHPSQNKQTNKKQMLARMQGVVGVSNPYTQLVGM
jgi:hypothetical protein